MGVGDSKAESRLFSLPLSDEAEAYTTFRFSRGVGLFAITMVSLAATDVILVVPCHVDRVIAGEKQFPEIKHFSGVKVVTTQAWL